MTEIVFTQNTDHKLTGFECSGHAGFRRYGKDIVCASVSALTINTVNSIEKFAGTVPDVLTDSKSGYMKCLVKEPNDKTELLLMSLKSGLEDISSEYGSKYCKVTLKER